MRRRKGRPATAGVVDNGARPYLTLLSLWLTRLLALEAAAMPMSPLQVTLAFPLSLIARVCPGTLSCDYRC